MSLPVISVVIPTYNRGAAIEKTIDSALRQNLPPAQVEIIVIDDGSTDETRIFLQRTYGSNPRVRIFSVSNGGVASARNLGLEHARGEFIAYLDHDDLWWPAKLRRQLEVARDRPDAAVVYCQWRDVNEQGTPLPATYWDTYFGDWTAQTGWVYDWVCAMPCPIVSMSVPLIHTRTLREIGGFAVEAVPCDDWDLWLRLARNHKFEAVPEILVDYVHHGQQQSADLVAIHAAMRRTLLRQWPFVLRRPSRWWFVWSFSRFLATAALYNQAKTALFARQTRVVARTIFRVAARAPLSLFSPQWLYLVRRFVSRNFESY